MALKNTWVAGESYDATAINAVATQINTNQTDIAALPTATSTTTLTNKTLTAPTISATTSSSGTALKFNSGTVMTTAAAGSIEYDGTCFYSTPAASSRGLNQAVWMCRQDATYTLTSSTAVQKLFNASTNGAVTLPVGTYRFNCMYSLSAMSATSGNSAFSLAVGTAVIAAIQMQTIGQDAATATVGALSGATAVTSALPASQHTAGVGTGQQSFITGTFEVSTTGTVIPSVQLVTAAAAVNAIGSFFECWLVGSQSVATIGNWS
jgi:hypothetical protein